MVGTESKWMRLLSPGVESLIGKEVFGMLTEEDWDKIIAFGKDGDYADLCEFLRGRRVELYREKMNKGEL
jgi:hypothetical protein